MKICIAHRYVDGPWGGGNSFVAQISKFLKRKNHDVVFDFSPDIDVILLIDPRPTSSHTFDMAMEYKRKYPRVKLVHRINDTDKARPNSPPVREDYFISINSEMDHTIFISEWVRNHYIDKGLVDNGNQTVIINGCDLNTYYPKSKPSNIRNGIDLITHHWSDGLLKGFDVYNHLDKFIDEYPVNNFTYMGRYNNQYFPQNLKLIPPQEPKQIGNILRQNNVYITGARWEACGMHHIEAAASGLPILYHKDGGAIPEICKSYGFEFDSPEAIVLGLEDMVDNYEDYVSSIDYEYLSLDRCCIEYEEVFLNV